MDVPFNSSFGFAEGTGPQTEMSARLFDRQPLRRIWTMMSLASLSLGFSVFGVLIIVNRHQADLHGRSGESFLAAAGGIGGLLIGMGFLVAGCLHWSTESSLGFSVKNRQQSDKLPPFIRARLSGWRFPGCKPGAKSCSHLWGNSRLSLLAPKRG
jgi:hypothetical protein